MKVVLGSLIVVAAAMAAMGQQAPKALTELIGSAEKIVKGAPFSCEAVSESFQTLPDGNKITRTTTNKMFRDSLGRFRREGMANPGATLGAYFELQPMVLILDPVEGFKYYLNTGSKTVKKLTFRVPAVIKRTTGGTLIYQPGQATTARALSSEEYAAAAARLRTEVRAQQDAAAGARVRTTTRDAERAGVAGEVKTVSGQLAVASSPGGVSGTGVSAAVVGVHGGKTYDTSTKTEDLGTQTIEGLPAEGKRVITTIPAGAIGNEKPIDVIYERWFSKDLDMIISSKHSDPRFGDQVYRLTNILRTEPDSSLFAVPADFKVVFEQAPGFKAPTPMSTPKLPTPPAPHPAPKPKIII